MPIYEYQCDECGDKTEAIQRRDDPPLTTCGACGGALRRLMSAPAFQFKGSGWYVTDYAGKGKPEKSDKGAASGGTAGESGDKAASGDGAGKAASSDSAKSAGSQKSDGSKSADGGAKSTD